MLVMCIYKCEFNIIVENIFGLKECFSKHYSYQIHIEVKLKRVISNENRTILKKKGSYKLFIQILKSK
jgi:hypothetical protein